MKLNIKSLTILKFVAVLLALFLVWGKVCAESTDSPGFSSQISAPEKPEAPVNKPISGIVEMTLGGFLTKTSQLGAKHLSSTEEMTAT